MGLSRKIIWNKILAKKVLSCIDLVSSFFREKRSIPFREHHESEEPHESREPHKWANDFCLTNGRSPWYSYIQLKYFDQCGLQQSIDQWLQEKLIDHFYLKRSKWTEFQAFRKTLKSTVIWIYEPPIDLTDETNQSKTECQFVKEKVACLNECRFDKFKARFLVGNSGVVVVVGFDNVIGHQYVKLVNNINCLRNP